MGSLGHTNRVIALRPGGDSLEASPSTRWPLQPPALWAPGLPWEEDVGGSWSPPVRVMLQDAFASSGADMGVGFSVP